MNEFERLNALSKRLKETYKPGMRIELEHMREFLLITSSLFTLH